MKKKIIKIKIQENRQSEREKFNIDEKIVLQLFHREIKRTKQRFKNFP